MDTSEIRRRFAEARVARLATVDPHDRPQLVPITFAALGEDTIVTAVDHKPKRTTELGRLRNIAANPAVSVLVDHYGEDWDELWWVRADGTGRVLRPPAEPELRTRALAALAHRYRQYREIPPAGAMIVIAVERWSGWVGAGPDLRPGGR
jgi:PPOX class probable F420-dependent enzyme